jgi:excisionase family DNA binding protein
MDLIEALRQRTSYMTTPETMALLRVRRNTLCEWVRAGKIKAIRRSNGYLFDPRYLAGWLEERAT